jgi:LysR family transcriptional regulator, low CO2-responsive transcriptional regulator
MRHPTLKQLQAVARIAELGTVTAAAERLNLSASAVSITLKQLEDGLGLRLFERTDKGFRPTEAGREYVLAEARISAVLGELAEVTGALQGGQTGHVAFGVVSTAKYFAPFLLRAFEDLYPRIEINLRVGNREEILSRLTDFSIDMALIGRPPQDLDVEKEEIGPHPHVVIAAPNHPLAGKLRVPASSLSNLTFLVREPGSGTRVLTERILSEIGAAPKTGMEISSNETIKQAVMAGLGISMLSYHTVAHEIEEGRLSVLHVEGTPVIRKWYVVRNKKKHLLPSAHTLWKFVAENGMEFLPPLKLTGKFSV